AHDPAHIRRSDGLLHRAALHQADPAPGEDTESTGHGYHPKAPDLDKQYDDELSEIRPVSSSVVNNQACHAYRRRGSKQSIRKRRDNTFFCGNRKHQQEAPQQNHQEKSEYDDPKRRRPA
ncbi:IS66 family insertion sequence element accessory protein TnpB, partial [Dysosmobacter welbionis]